MNLHLTTSKRFILFATLALFVLIVIAIVVWRTLSFDRSAEVAQAPVEESSSTNAPTSSSSLVKVVGTKSENPFVPLRSVHRRASMDNSLPPDGTPWRQVFFELIDRAESGDKAASDRLYDDTFGCIQYGLVLNSARERLRIKSDADKLSVDQIIRELDHYDIMQSVLRENATSCANVTREELFEQMYPILLAAARNGNERAAACYAFGPYQQPESGASGNAAALKEWANNAMEIMQAGISRGDWKMVILLRRYFDPMTREFSTSSDTDWELRQFKPDPMMAYRYSALRAIGAEIDGDEDARNRTSRMLAGFKERYNLSDAQVRRADEWAESTYQQFFAGRPWVGANDVSWCAHGD